MTACLYETPEGYGRRDYCEACPVPDEPPAVAAWRTRRPMPVEKKARVFDRATVYQFFERLVEPETPEQRQLRFVLALLLWRKKVLKLKGSDAGPEGEVWHFVATGNTATFEVVRPDLGEDELERLGTQIETLLASGDAAPAAESPVAAEAPGEPVAPTGVAGEVGGRDDG